MKIFFSFIALLLIHSTNAQSRLPVIQAGSVNVSISDGGYLDKNVWTLSPRIRPDVYTADRTRQAKWVIFYTDIDSIKVKVTPGSVFDFVVLLNGKDSCFTRIASAIRPGQLLPNSHTKPDTIPFTLTAFNAISVPAIINGTDTLRLHFDVGSFDFRITKNALLHKTSLLPNKADALAGKQQPDYNHLNKVTSIQMGQVSWYNPETIATGMTAHDMDGRFGWNLFEGKIVEINYDRTIMVIHSALPAIAKGYTKSALIFMRSFVCARAGFTVGNKKYRGNFLLDTGSDQAIVVDSSWAAKQQFPRHLPLITSSVLRDPRGVQYETKTVRAPLFSINHYTLANIPTLMLGSKNPVNFEVNYLGNDLLKRFNILLDFKNDNLYLKPNLLTGLPYRASS